MDTISMVNEQMEAGARFICRYDKAIPVAIAYWMKLKDVWRSYLYIASDKFNADGKDSGYSDVTRVAREMNDPDFDSFRVKLVPTNDPLVRELIGLRNRVPGDKPLRYSDTYMGGMGIEWIYVYPLSAAVSA